MGYISGTAGQPPRARKGGTGAGAGADALVAAPAARPADAGNVPGVRIGTTVQGMPMIKPPYGRLTAIELDKGDFKRQIPFGPTPDAVRNNPALKGVTLAPTWARPGSASARWLRRSLLDTRGRRPALGVTASGARGANLHAYDKLTGNEVASVYLPAPQSGSPMTYMLNGKQYIVVAVSGGAYSGEYIAPGYRLNNMKARLSIALALAAVLFAQTSRSVWDGVYTDDQAKRGKTAYSAQCAMCHGEDLMGSDETPALTGGTFLANWTTLSVNDLFERVRVFDAGQQPRPSHPAAGCRHSLLPVRLQ